jgi:hypothetical protein
MRVLNNLAVLAATLPIVLSASVPPPGNLCKLCSQRCHNNDIEECGDHGNYFLVQACAANEYCIINTCDPNALGQCIPQDCIQPPCSEKTRHERGTREALESCPKVGQEHCVRNQIQECGIERTWINTEVCDMARKCVENDGEAHCAILSTLETCPKVGEQQCVGKQIQERSIERTWLNTEGCAPIEECVDEDGHAHCIII